jgi:D-alanyl-D-alanine carboxypeptidase
MLDWRHRHRNPMPLPLLALALGLLGWISPSSADAATVSERLDVALHQSWGLTDSPGVQAAVLRNGKLAWQATAGEAVIGRRVATNRSLFEFGSFSKMMLAAFALHRVEVGRLALDVPIRAYVGRSIPGSGRVTLRMLLSHTAGYPDVYERPPVSELLGANYDPNRRWTFSRVFEALGKPRHPGRRWEYSNSGYIVLAYLLRRTTDRPLSDAIMHFLKPAGRVEPISERSLTMRRTAEAAHLFAHGYLFGYDVFTGAKTIPTDLYGMPWGDGLFSGTALGGAQFLDALLVRNRLLSTRAVKTMITPTSQSRATDSPGLGDNRYGFGTYRLNAAGRRWQGHDGSYPGYSVMGFTNRRYGVTIFVATNGWTNQGLPAISIWRALARAYVG